MPNLSLGISGMHGQIGTGLTPRHAANYAAALGTYVDGGEIVLGCDSRHSSPMLRHSVVAGLLAAGCRVHDAGLCPSPAVRHLARTVNASAGLLIGGGHLPADWNSLVPFGADGSSFNSVQSQSLLDTYHSGRYRQCTWNALGSLVPLDDSWLDGYLDRVLAPFDVAAIAAAKFTVVADLCNGSGGRLMVPLADRLGINLVSINDNRLGILPHDPEPRPRAAVQVQALMKPLGAHLGFVTNSDMTRLSLVTCEGETLSEEYTFPLVADHILRRRGSPGTVIANVCTSRSLDHVVAAHGGELVKVKVGQAHVIDAMLERRACLAGEGCGSVALPETGPWYSGYATLVAILESMAVGNTSSTDLLGGLTRYHIIKRKVPCATSRGYSLVNRLRDAFGNAQQTDVDGLRFDFDDGWIHVRVSGTEPAVRLIAEWTTREGAIEKATEVRSLIERQFSA